MTPGEVFYIGPHAFAQQAYMARAFWTRLPMPEVLREDEIWTEIQTLLVSVPPLVQERFFLSLWEGQLRGKATLFPIKQDASCLALLSLVAGQDAVVTVLDLAGNGTAPELGRAAREGATFAVLVSQDEDEMRPLLPIDGLAAAVDQASLKPRLAARELVEGVGELRAALGGSKLFEILGIPEQPLQTLTIAVGQPVLG